MPGQVVDCLWSPAGRNSSTDNSQIPRSRAREGPAADLASQPRTATAGGAPGPCPACHLGYDGAALLAGPGDMRARKRVIPPGDKSCRAPSCEGTSQTVRVAHRVDLMASARSPIICCESVAATGSVGQRSSGARAWLLRRVSPAHAAWRLVPATDPCRIRSDGFSTADDCAGAQITWLWCMVFPAPWLAHERQQGDERVLSRPAEQTRISGNQSGKLRPNSCAAAPRESWGEYQRFDEVAYRCIDSVGVL